MRQAVQIQAELERPIQRSNDPPASEHIRSARYAGRRRKAGLLQHGVEILLWVTAGSGAIALALATHDSPSQPAAVSEMQAAENAGSGRVETSSPLALKHLDSRAKAELASKLRIKGLATTSGNTSASALVEWADWLDPPSGAAVGYDRMPSRRTHEKLAADRPVPVDDIRLEPTITGSISADETSSNHDRWRSSP
jgi:hypothetical protein